MLDIGAGQDIGREAQAASTEGRLVYAVGDVHGRLDLLKPLIGQIAADALATAPDARPVLVMLGDYVDRGPQSAAVIDFLVRLADYDAFELRTLKGNHEAAVLRFLDDPRFGDTWARFGGRETLASYGIAPPSEGAPSAAWSQARDAFVEALPEQHLNFLHELELMVEIGGYLFVHAGVAPERPLNQQSEEDLLWIRDEFMRSRRTLERVIVHGHTPVAAPEVAGSRISIDTGAYASHVLTAVRLFDDQRAFLQASLRTERPEADLLGLN